MIRILIAKDQALVRLRPDVVLMDVHMPPQGGVAATREITRMLPGT